MDTPQLSRADVEAHLRAVVADLPRPDCPTCECFQGFLAQLQLDAATDVGDLTGPLRVSAHRAHGCLGCDPCPPGDAFADYLRDGCGGCGCDTC